MANLRQKTNIPIAAGQCFGHSWQHRDFIVNQAIDISQPNVCFVGGYTEAIKVANLARASNLPIANGGGWPHHNLYLQAAISNGSKVEFHYVMWKVGETIFANPAEPEDSYVNLPEQLGLGFEPSPEAMQEYQLVD